LRLLGRIPVVYLPFSVKASVFPEQSF
jgi:hypothetical protein